MLNFNIEPGLIEALKSKKTPPKAAKYTGPDAPEGIYRWQLIVIHLAETRAGDPVLKLRAEIVEGPYAGYRASSNTILPLDQDSKAFPYQVVGLDDLLGGLTRGKVKSEEFIQALANGEVHMETNQYGQNIIESIGSSVLEQGSLFKAELTRNKKGYTDLVNVE